MPLEDDLKQEVGKIFRGAWTRRDMGKVPEPNDLSLGNDGANIEAAVLYADMVDSTGLVDRMTATFAAEVYKAYLTCAARIVRDDGGAITAYDGDRIMAVFIGPQKRTIAARVALKINYAVANILNPALQNQYSSSIPDFVFKHTVGVDCSKLLVARIGIRNDNDLVWVGRAANHAAKLANLKDRHSVFITKNVFDSMDNGSKFGGTPPQQMWEERTWSSMNNATIYSSNWTWRP